jgi:hypothetical protein
VLAAHRARLDLDRYLELVCLADWQVAEDAGRAGQLGAHGEPRRAQVLG